MKAKSVLKAGPTFSGQGGVPRRMGRAVAALATVLTLAMTGTAVAAHGPHWQHYQLDNDHFSDAATIDRDGNGNADDIYHDLDNDGAYDTNIYNTRYSDRLLEVTDYDMDENDEVEFRLVDGDQRVGFDYLYVDLDQNGYWDSWRRRVRRIVPGSNIDHVTRTNRYNASRNLMHSFRMRTGQSLLYPTFPTP